MQTNWREKALALHSELGISKLFRTLPPESGIRDSKFEIALACSGGADSLAVLLLTWAEFPEMRERLLVLHFDHSVRAESIKDAEFVRKVCAELGVEYVCEKRVPENNEKLGETELRRLRLDFFAREMRSRNIKILLQGHQRDDVAETLLMRLTRGAGADGLAAPRKISRQVDGRIFIRPLLDVPKEKILAALRACEIPWCEDETNAGTDYFRNRVRNLVLPELRAAAPFENIARSRKLLEEDADALDFFAEKIFEKIRNQASYTKSQTQFCPVPDVCASECLPKAIVRRILRKIFVREKIETDGATAFDALVEAVCAGTPKKMQIGARNIFWDGKILRIPKGNISGTSPGSDKSNPVKATEMPAVRWKAEQIDVTETLLEEIRAGKFSPEETVFLAGTPEIAVRELFPGEKYRPLGAPGEKLVRRIFIDKKIPQNLRKKLPVFADGTGIAWIPGLPPAERFRIRNAGTTALRLTYRREALPL